MIYRQYQPPAGYYDVPYFYVYPAQAFVRQGVTGTSSTKNISNQSIVLNGAECSFTLRRIIASAISISPGNDPTLPPYGIQLRNYGNSNRYSSYRPLPNGVLPITTEEPYPYASQISFDVFGISQFGWNYQPAGVPTANSVPLGQLIFEGVRRYQGNMIDKHTIKERYRESIYTYILKVPIDWYYYNDGATLASGISPLHRFYINIQNGDFDLKSISVLGDTYPISTTGTAGLVLQDEIVANVLTFTATVTGASGNLIHLLFDTSGGQTPNRAASISVAGNNITVLGATNGGGNNTTTVSQFVTLWNSSAPALALATVVGTGIGPAPSTTPVVGDYFSGGTASPGATHPFQYSAAIVVYDSNIVAMMSSPVNVSALNSSALAIGDANYGVPVPSGLGAVCPASVYPDQGLLTVDVQSLLTSSECPTGNVITLAFSGVRRRALL